MFNKGDKVLYTGSGVMSYEFYDQPQMPKAVVTEVLASPVTSETLYMVDFYCVEGVQNLCCFEEELEREAEEKEESIPS